MEYKDYLKKNYNMLQKIKELLQNNDPEYFSKQIVNETICNDNTISIVMTASNRSIQTYFTLGTIAKSEYKNVQVIIVDDSSKDPIQIEELDKYGVHIELITIKNKFWINPCVNYNIGFNQVKGGKVIIQNAEVCHVGDVINYVNNNINDEHYHVFNVVAMKNMDCNRMLYTIPNLSHESLNIIQALMYMWYQHETLRNAYLHFLSALTKKSLDKIKGFDIDYSLGIEYDDNALLDQITNSGVKVINSDPLYFGIHQWHERSEAGSGTNNITNQRLFGVKKSLLEKYGTYLNFTELPKNAFDILVDLLFQ